MSLPKLTKLELQIMETLWNRGACSIREVQEAFPETRRPAYTTVQTTVYRLESKKAVRCVKRISNANIFEAAISRGEAQGKLIDELLGLFGGRTNQNDSGEPDTPSQPPVAIHSVGGDGWTFELGIEKATCPGSVRPLAGGISQVPHSLCIAGKHGSEEHT